MKYYAHISPDNRLLGYYTDDLHDTIPTPNIELTHEQWLTSLNNNYNVINSDGSGSVVDFSTDEETAAQVRSDRDYKLLTEVDPLVTNPLRWAELTSDKQTEWSQYRTDLLNVPQQSGFPNTITWPVKPE